MLCEELSLILADGVRLILGVIVTVGVCDILSLTLVVVLTDGVTLILGEGVVVILTDAVAVLVDATGPRLVLP